jgi:hypothetical protein
MNLKGEPAKFAPFFPLSLDGRKGGQASSEDLFPLGYGERERVRVRVNFCIFICHFDF